MTIGEKLLELRRAAGLSAARLGELVGMQEQAVLRLERDSTRNPGLTTLLRLVKALGHGLGVFDDISYLPDRRGARKVRA
jgi:transcriptional regulator with XRE-family HTH domain